MFDLTELKNLDQQLVFIVFVSVMVVIAIVIFVFNELSIRRKQKIHEAELEISRKRLDAISKADAQHTTAVETLFRIHKVASEAIADLDKEHPNENH